MMPSPAADLALAGSQQAFFWPPQAETAPFSDCWSFFIADQTQLLSVHLPALSLEQDVQTPTAILNDV